MVTCRQLLQLDSFANIPLVAGRAGLDRVVSWPYPKHTKTVSPWVHGGEFLLISGYEFGVNEEELLQMIQEAATSQLSGILVEGGINFKSLSERVIRRADEAAIPLFFASGSVKFIDISREISSLILENQMLAKRDSSLLDQLLDASGLSGQERVGLLERAGLSGEELFAIAHFIVSMRDEHSGLNGGHVVKDIHRTVDAVLENFGLKPISQDGVSPTDAVTYLLYYRDPSQAKSLAEALQKSAARLQALHGESDIYLAFSQFTLSAQEIQDGFNQAHYTAQLMQHRLLPPGACTFGETGSYQILFRVDRKEILLRFRDDYLKKLYQIDHKSSSQLLDTLRTYLQNNGNMLRTAEILIIHRNTLQYRMDRIKAILQLDLNSPFVKRDILNAFMILDLFPFSGKDSGQEPGQKK